MKTLQIDKGGHLTLPTLVRRELAGEALTLLSSSDAHLLLTANGRPQPVLLAGRLGDLTVADLVSFFNMFRRTGLLHFDLPGGQKDVWFQDGEIIFATSTYPEEDLAEVLHGMGRLDAGTLRDSRRQVTAGRLLAQVLLEQGLLSQQDLWSATRQQAELIVYNLFAESQGSFCYRQASPTGMEQLRLSMSTQNLLMEGLRRLDERTLFMRRIPSLEARVLPQDRGEEALARLAGELRHAYDLACAASLSVRELIRRAGVGEFEGLRLIYQLAEHKFLLLEEPAQVPAPEELRRILALFNELLAAMYERLAPKRDDFRRELADFMRDIPQPYSFVLRDVAVTADGSLDGDRIVTNLEGLAEADQKALLADTLSELLYMECMVARQVLSPEQSQVFVRRVQEVGRQVRTIVGRRKA